ncbi:hypothetical protein O9929_13690 [Vibrio lentus]|nr:hypothetical protein [Vibrio lentus]
MGAAGRKCLSRPWDTDGACPDSSGMGYNLYGGYQFNRTAGVELGCQMIMQTTRTAQTSYLRLFLQYSAEPVVIRSDKSPHSPILY